MTNLEKYAEEIKNYEGNDFCTEFIQPIILKYFNRTCDNTDCDQCHMLQMIWANEEYTEPEEPEVDWSTVEVDTPILVKNVEQEHWYKRYFAGYKNGKVSAWVNGATSWTALDEDDDYTWNYAKLAEGEDE